MAVNYLKPEFSPDAFAGTALYYSRYRIPYPQILLKDLIEQTAPSSQGKLLDLASGPGRIAIQLAPLFYKVWANDIDSEMVAVGKIEAKKRKINNIEWFIGRAEELKIVSNSIDLITIGEAFHRLNQNLIANLTLQWLKPGCHIAIVGCYSFLNGNEPWQNAIKKIINKWTSYNPLNQRKSKIPDSERGPEHFRLVLQNKGFVECNIYSFAFPHYWTIKSIIGNLYSTSYCSKKVLGNKVREFESELKAALYKINKRGRFLENMRCGYTLGKKPCEIENI